MSQEKSSRLDKIEKDVKNLLMAMNNTLEHVKQLNGALSGTQMVMENLPGIEEAIAKAKEAATKTDSTKKTEDATDKTTPLVKSE